MYTLQHVMTHTKNCIRDRSLIMAGGGGGGAGKEIKNFQ